MAKNKEKEKVGAKKQRKITVKANKKGRHIMPMMNVLRVLIIPIYFLVKPFKFYGKRKVQDGACIYICNHYSLFDPVYAACTTWEGIHFIAKREAFSIPIVSRILRRIKAISVNRDGNDARSLLDAFKCLKNGEKICVYPEGTRNKDNGEIQPFRHGAAVMAIKTKTPIVPLVITRRPKLFRRTHILIGKPFELSEYYDKKLTETELADIDESLRRLLIDMREKHMQMLSNKKKTKA